MNRERRVDWCMIKTWNELVSPKLSFPSDHVFTVGEVLGQVINSEGKTHFVKLRVGLQGFPEIVECINWARLAGNHIRVGDDKWVFCPKFGAEPAEPRGAVPQISVVVHHMAAGVGKKLDHRWVCAGVITQPNVVLPSLFQPRQ